MQTLPGTLNSNTLSQLSQTLQRIQRLSAIVKDISSPEGYVRFRNGAGKSVHVNKVQTRKEGEQQGVKEEGEREVGVEEEGQRGRERTEGVEKKEESDEGAEGDEERSRQRIQRVDEVVKLIGQVRGDMLYMESLSISLSFLSLSQIACVICSCLNPHMPTF